MTEGCHGGWGFLNGLFLEQYYAVAEDCAPYKQATEDDGCHKYKDCEPVAKVSRTYYVGGHYGAMSEETIMRELRANGPLLFDFDAGSDFGVYSDGILMESVKELSSLEKIDSAEQSEMIEDSSEQATVTDRSYEDYQLQWERLTHSTLLIGWGYDDDLKTKFWLVRNSYGHNWGEQGNFRVRRGMNDYGCESELAAITPLLLN